METPERIARRPIPARGTPWTVAVAGWLQRRGVRPNQVSLLSLGFAGLASVCLLVGAGSGPGWRIALLLVAAACLPLRLLCNLFDGMLAVEGGLKSAAGDLYNELPDRVSDLVILVAAGYAVTSPGWARDLGWVAATLAVLTAYVRTLGGATGASQYFVGPMAKQRRMEVMAVACVLAAAETALGWPPRVMVLALAIVASGSAITIVRRVRLIARDLATADGTEGSARP